MKNEVLSQNEISKDEEKTINLGILNFKNYIGILKRSGIYFLINLSAFIYEISYKEPSSFEITLKDMNLKYSFINDKSGIGFETIRKALIGNVFLIRILIFILLFFLWTYFKNYPRMKKCLAYLIFFNSTILASFLLNRSFSLNSLPFICALIASLIPSIIMFYHILRNKEYQKPSLIKTLVKSIVSGVLILNLIKLILMYPIRSSLVPILKFVNSNYGTNAGVLEKLEKFCSDSNFNISNIYVYDFKRYDPFFHFTISFIFKDYIFVPNYSMLFLPYESISILYHEIVHTYMIDHIMRFSFSCLISFSVFFFIDHKIGPNLNSNNLYKLIETGIVLSIILEMFNYSSNFTSCMMEEACDTNAMSTRENAFNFVRFFMKSLCNNNGKMNFKDSSFSYRSPSISEPYSSILNRILRAIRKYPDDFEIKLNYD